MKKNIRCLLAMGLVITLTAGMYGCKSSDKTLTITNVSYDATRDFYEEYNNLFEAYYESRYNEPVEVIQSHGGSGSQARSVVEGCNADVVTLALEHDISLIESTGLIDTGWEDEYENTSSPYTSTIVFLVRKGNPKGIHDWNDLVKDGVEIITPDPKSSGGACWNFLAALSYAQEYEIVNPSVSITAQPSVAVVDDNVRMNHSENAAAEYLGYLYSDEAQRLAAQYGYRPYNKNILNEFTDKFDITIRCTSIEDFGGWKEAYRKYFDDGALFDRIYNS